jgi:hypothetical protein
MAYGPYRIECRGSRVRTVHFYSTCSSRYSTGTVAHSQNFACMDDRQIFDSIRVIGTRVLTDSRLRLVGPRSRRPDLRPMLYGI